MLKKLWGQDEQRNCLDSCSRNAIVASVERCRISDSTQDDGAHREPDGEQTEQWQTQNSNLALNQVNVDVQEKWPLGRITLRIDMWGQEKETHALAIEYQPLYRVLCQRAD